MGKQKAIEATGHKAKWSKEEGDILTSLSIRGQLTFFKQIKHNEARILAQLISDYRNRHCLLGAWGLRFADFASRGVQTNS
jgi:hypothetical protein